MTDDAATICYCFNYTAGDIRRDASWQAWRLGSLDASPAVTR